jgi:flagellar biosynthesis protein FliR
MVTVPAQITDTQFLMTHMPAFWLIVMRVSGLFVTAPVFHQPQVPMLVKALWALLLAALLTCCVPVAQVPMIRHEWQLIVLGVQELALGAMLGMAAQLIQSVFQMAGEVIALQTGLNMAGMMDPVSRVPSTAIANLLSTFAMLVFVGCNGHHWLLASLVKSLHALPPGCTLAGVSDTMVTAFTHWPQTIGLQVVQLALPIVGIMVLLDVATGYLAKSMPQLSLLTLTPPIKILLGLSLVASCLPGYQAVIEHQIQAMPSMLHTIWPARRLAKPLPESPPQPTP